MNASKSPSGREGGTSELLSDLRIEVAAALEPHTSDAEHDPDSVFRLQRKRVAAERVGRAWTVLGQYVDGGNSRQGGLS